MLANFLGVLPILIPPLCALAFIMCSKSNPIVVFALDLMSTYEGEHTIFGLLGQANLTLYHILNTYKSFSVSHHLWQNCSMPRKKVRNGYSIR
jgi:hypothetical protein